MINYKNNTKKVNRNNSFISLIKSIALNLILLVFSIHGMEVERAEVEGMEVEEKYTSFEYDNLQGLGELYDDILPEIFGYLDQGRLLPYQLFTAMEISICPISINDFITTGMVCHKWRDINLSMRGKRILSITEKKELISLEDYEVIRNSGYKTLCLFSKCIVPKDISYLDCFNRIENIAFLPPKGTRAYSYADSIFKQVALEEKYLNLNVINNIYRLENLKMLSLNGNNLGSDDLQSVLQLSNLSKIDLSYNNPTAEFLLGFSSLKGLKTLKLLRVRIENSKSFRSTFSHNSPECVLQLFG